MQWDRVILAVLILGGAGAVFGPEQYTVAEVTITVPRPVMATLTDLAAPAASTPTARAGRPTTTPEDAGPGTVTPTPTESLTERRVARLIHQQINAERTERGLSALAFDPALARVADAHSEDMARREYFSHTAPNGSDFADRYRRFGYQCEVQINDSWTSGGAENILYTWYQVELDKRGDTYYETPRDLAQGVVNSWLNSTGHRKNILRPYWHREGIGVAVVQTESGLKVYVTQNFC